MTPLPYPGKRCAPLPAPPPSGSDLFWCHVCGVYVPWKHADPPQLRDCGPQPRRAPRGLVEPEHIGIPIHRAATPKGPPCPR